MGSQSLCAFGVGKLQPAELVQRQLNQELQNLIRIPFCPQIPRQLFDIVHDAASLQNSI